MATDMLVIQMNGAPYNNASSEVWAPTCHALAFFRFDSGCRDGTARTAGTRARPWLQQTEGQGPLRYSCDVPW